MNPNWLLPEYANPQQVVVSGDPAEALARLARMHGCMALDMIELKRPGDPVTTEIFGEMVEHAARAAFRFAQAALDLDRLRRRTEALAALPQDEPEDDTPGDEPPYMQALRELAKPWKSEVVDE